METKSQKVDYSINTENSANIVIDRIHKKLHVSVFRPKDLEGTRASIVEYVKNQLPVLRKYSIELLKSELSVKGYYSHTDEQKDIAFRNYHRTLSITKQLVSDIRKTYKEAFSMGKYKSASADGRSFLNMEQITHLAEQELKNLPQLLRPWKYNDNPLSIEKLLQRAEEENIYSNDFIDHIQTSWKIPKGKYMSEIIGVPYNNLVGFYRVKNIGHASSSTISDKLFSSNNPLLISVLSGNHNIISKIREKDGKAEENPQQLIINAYREKISKKDDISERQKLAGEMFGDLIGLSGRSQADICRENNLFPEYISRFTKKGIVNPPPEKIKRLVKLIPLLTVKQQEQVSYIFNDLTDFRSADELLADPFVNKKTFINNIYKRSLMDLGQFSKHLGVNKETLNDILDGKTKIAAVVVKIRKPLGVSDVSSNRYLDLMLDKTKITVIDQKNFLKNYLNEENPKLSVIRETIGITKREVTNKMHVSDAARRIYENNNMIPDNSLDNAITAYRIPIELEEIFKLKFAKGDRKLNPKLPAEGVLVRA